MLKNNLIKAIILFLEAPRNASNKTLKDTNQEENISFQNKVIQLLK